MLIEDDKSHADLICRALEDREDKINLTVAQTIKEARTILEGPIPDIVFADYALPDGKGIELLPGNQEKLSYPIVIMTCHGDERIAVESMKMGGIGLHYKI